MLLGKLSLMKDQSNHLQADDVNRAPDAMPPSISFDIMTVTDSENADVANFKPESRRYQKKRNRLVRKAQFSRENVSQDEQSRDNFLQARFNQTRDALFGNEARDASAAASLVQPGRKATNDSSAGEMEASEDVLEVVDYISDNMNEETTEQQVKEKTVTTIPNGKNPNPADKVTKDDQSGNQDFPSGRISTDLRSEEEKLRDEQANVEKYGWDKKLAIKEHKEKIADLEKQLSERDKEIKALNKKLTLSWYQREQDRQAYEAIINGHVGEILRQKEETTNVRKRHQLEKSALEKALKEQEEEFTNQGQERRFLSMLVEDKVRKLSAGNRERENLEDQAKRKEAKKQRALAKYRARIDALNRGETLEQALQAEPANAPASPSNATETRIIDEKLATPTSRFSKRNFAIAASWAVSGYFADAVVQRVIYMFGLRGEPAQLGRGFGIYGLCY